jgi:sugar phosphate isomerase/epimerase
MDIHLFKSTWGMTEPLPEALERIARAAFDGVEIMVPPEDPLRTAAQRAAVLASGLEVIPLVVARGPGKDLYRAAVEEAASYGPRQITSHTASDAMGDAEAVDFLGFALDLEEEIGIPIGHETHRTRILFTPWRTADILRQLPRLKLVADYSHWVVVAERLLEDRADDMALANRHAIHIHARVGHPEGPQVNDPRAPGSVAALAAHEAWWVDIFRQRALAGADRITVTPEYGPAPYMPTIPFTDEPGAHLWEICVWGAARMRALFAETHGLQPA